ncbi:CoA transferase [Bosea caraganae]|uniref:CoA transferase n=1 Tax=Bosea caraganae TaxID=2763117 RepID=A0A370LCX6_9HYPH|nr:CoA transferase [Bosea caraganae]RDJ27809.1 CoA transferase [Bosea caraganae]RDJ29822.1 CoA transferase [Bosea caraganae]
MAGALDGIRVVDFSRVFAGPAATQILGDLGADVVKVEAPLTGDEARYLGLTEGTEPRLGVSPSYLALNRNKRSIALDLQSEAGRKVARRLITQCDVAVHNFRPGAMKKWRLDYESVQEANPSLIYGEFFAYGPSGPLSDFGANDLALQAHSGLMSLTGEPGRPPVRVGTAVVDLHGSLALVGAVMAALYSRTQTGRGQRVEASLLLSSAHLLNYFYSEYWIDGTIRKPMGTANHLSVPNQVFPTADGSVVIIAPSDAMWQRCARALDAERLAIPRYKTVRDRQTHRTEVIEAISAVTSLLSSQEVIERLGPVKVNVAKVNNAGEAAEHPQLAESGGVTQFDYAGETVKAVSSPFRLSGTPATIQHAPPELDQHRDEILADYGFAADEVRRLEEAGAFSEGERTGRKVASAG